MSETIKSEAGTLSSHLIQKIKTSLKQYADKTGMVSIILDDKGNVIEEREKSWICQSFYCRNKEKCIVDHRFVLKEAYRLGGPYMHLCHKDFVIWGVSVTTEKEPVGGVLSGFVLFEQHRGQLNRYIDDFPLIKGEKKFVSSQQVNDASSALFNLFRQENLFDVDLFKSLENRAHIQREIAEKIIEKKSKEEFGRHAIYQKQDTLINAVRFMEVEKIKSGLNDVLSEVFLEGINNIKLLKFRMLELFVLISRTMLEVGGNIDEFYDLTSQYAKNTEDLDDIYSFSLWLTDVLNDFVSTVIKTRKKLGHINRAIEYIKTHLEKKLTLAEVSSIVFMSESRFSAAFKQETGMVFSEYVNMVKIERAKELLSLKELTFVEIALKLDFFDQSYFTKIFKKYTGTTPSKFIK
ncbi:AraC family transcriptional regulator [bacterium]|nr:AraC family transcriptional regulator [bacterium]